MLSITTFVIITKSLFFDNLSILSTKLGSKINEHTLNKIILQTQSKIGVQTPCCVTYL